MSGRGAWIGGAILAIAAIAVAVMASRQGNTTPFDAASPAPDGYEALAILLRDRGADVRSRTAARVTSDPVTAGAVVVVPAPDLLTDPEVRAVYDAARAGAVVVLGSPRPEDPGDDSDADGLDGLDGLFGSLDAAFINGRLLAETPAEPSRPGACDIDRLEGLGPIDTAFATPIDPTTSVAEVRSCYGDPSGSYITEERIGDGTLVTLGSPYLWVNARLQPDKEHGGRPLDNAATALRLLGPGSEGATGATSVTFVDARPTAGVAPDGSRNPVELLPIGVKLAILQLVAAFVVYAWWRARRLGPVVSEKMPVEIAGSELVIAVGDLLRRKGTPQRAADVLRADARRELASRLGVPAGAPPEVLVSVVANRSGRDPEHVAAALADAPVTTAEALVRLADSLSDIRQEVLSNHVVR